MVLGSRRALAVLASGGVPRRRRSLATARRGRPRDRHPHHETTFAVADTHEWIEAQGIPSKEIHILEGKWRIECDVYLDDGPHVLPGLVAHRPDRLVCRYVRPWNRPVPGVVDVADFDDFRALVARVE